MTPAQKPGWGWHRGTGRAQPQQHSSASRVASAPNNRPFKEQKLSRHNEAGPSHSTALVQPLFVSFPPAMPTSHPKPLSVEISSVPPAPAAFCSSRSTWVPGSPPPALLVIYSRNPSEESTRGTITASKCHPRPPHLRFGSISIIQSAHNIISTLTRIWECALPTSGNQKTNSFFFVFLLWQNLEGLLILHYLSFFS